MRHVLRFILLTLALALPSSAWSEADGEPEILYLLEYVADSGCTFIRNGVEHESTDAADHLHLKYQRGKRYAGTAEQFIDRLASGSSWTGKPYSVTCQGKTELSGTWLHRALEEHRSDLSQTDS